VVKVDPAYTSQTCAVCGHVGQANRKTQATFKCTACGHTANADRNAAINILDRGRPLIRQARGEGASARRGAFGIKPTPMIREPDMPTSPPGP
ncbi:MAG: transposase, partial [Caldilineaceae bacterium]|nr:transposase [Caldilineaceae bacterium]